MGRAEVFALSPGEGVFRAAFDFFVVVEVRRRAVFNGARFVFAPLFSFCRFLVFFGTIWNVFGIFG